MSARLDGNVLAGPLSEVFLADMTIADACCVNCDDVSVVALASVEVDGGSFIIRCHRCDAVMATLSAAGDSARLETVGLRWLQIPQA